MSQIGVGVVGCGIGRWHVEGFSADPRAELLGLAGIDVDRCELLAAEFEVPNVYSDYRKLLDRPDISIVSVAVPNFLHVPIGLDVINAGKHLIMEKPLARTSEEAQLLVDAAEEAGVELGIFFNRRARPDSKLLYSMAVGGEFGDIYHARAFWQRRSGIPGLGTWFTTKEQAGGGPLIDLGVHVLDLALWLMGDPEVETVSASTHARIGVQGKGGFPNARFQDNPANPYEVEDMANAFLRTTDGASIFLESSWAEYTGATDEFGVYLRGDKAGADLHVKDYATVDTVTLYSDSHGLQIDSKPRLTERSASSGHAVIISNFLDSVIAGTPVSPSGADGLQRSVLLDAIYQSAEENREILLKSADTLSRTT